VVAHKYVEDCLHEHIILSDEVWELLKADEMVQAQVCLKGGPEMALLLLRLRTERLQPEPERGRQVVLECLDRQLLVGVGPPPLPLQLKAPSSSSFSVLFAAATFHVP